MSPENFNQYLFDLNEKLTTVGGVSLVRCDLLKTPLLVTLQNEDGTNLLIETAGIGNTSVIEVLCELGSDINLVDSLGETALINTIRSAAFQTIDKETQLLNMKILLDYGANPNQLAYDGCSALHQAVIFSQLEAVQLLFCNHADAFVRLDDPPSQENSIELVKSTRFRGTKQEQNDMYNLLLTSINNSEQ